jgi:hypothetical protein
MNALMLTIGSMRFLKHGSTPNTRRNTCCCKVWWTHSNGFLLRVLVMTHVVQRERHLHPLPVDAYHPSPVLGGFEDPSPAILTTGSPSSRHR